MIKLTSDDKRIFVSIILEKHIFLIFAKVFSVAALAFFAKSLAPLALHRRVFLRIV